MDNSNKEIEKYFILEYVLHKYYGIKSHTSSSINTSCEICLDNLKDGVVMELPCGHSYHYLCIYANLIEYKRYSCPSCNYKLVFN